MFRRYTTIHIGLTLAAFAVALTWIIISASRHNTAVTNCENNFFAASNSTSSSEVSTVDEGKTLCLIFTWVDVGLMGGLWVILAIMQFYLYTVVSSYGTGQRIDHEKYKQLYSITSFNDIPMATNRGDPWDARASTDDVRGGAPGGYSHARNESTASVSTILAEKPQQPLEYGRYSDAAEPTTYPPQRRDTYNSARQRSVDNGYLPQPDAARTQDPGPTPYAYDNFYQAGYGGSPVEQPGRSQAHPGMS